MSAPTSVTGLVNLGGKAGETWHRADEPSDAWKNGVVLPERTVAQWLEWADDPDGEPSRLLHVDSLDFSPLWLQIELTSHMVVAARDTRKKARVYAVPGRMDASHKVQVTVSPTGELRFTEIGGSSIHHVTVQLSPEDWARL